MYDTEKFSSSTSGRKSSVWNHLNWHFSDTVTCKNLSSLLPVQPFCFRFPTHLMASLHPTKLPHIPGYHVWSGKYICLQCLRCKRPQCLGKTTGFLLVTVRCFTCRGARFTPCEYGAHNFSSVIWRERGECIILEKIEIWKDNENRLY